MRIRKLTATLLMLFSVAGSADATLMSDLMNGGSITAGDKLFDSWTLINYAASDAARIFNAGNIDVTALNDGGMNPGPGLNFAVLNDELTVTGDGIFAYVDLTFQFHVSVLDPTKKIADNSLTLSFCSMAWAPKPNDLGSYIHETVGTAAGLQDLGSKAVECSVLDDALTTNLFDSAAFSPLSDIWVDKNILVWSVNPTDTATLGSFEQRFSQVPEPATLGLTLLGLAGLASVRRRKSA